MAKFKIGQNWTSGKCACRCTRVWHTANSHSKSTWQEAPTANSRKKSQHQSFTRCSNHLVQCQDVPMCFCQGRSLHGCPGQHCSTRRSLSFFNCGAQLSLLATWPLRQMLPDQRPPISPCPVSHISLCAHRPHVHVWHCVRSLP